MAAHGRTEGIALIIFGVTGDLTRRKLIPALYELHLVGRLPQPFYIIGFARREWTNELMAEELRKGVVDFARTKPVDDKKLKDLLENVHYINSTFNNPDGYLSLKTLLDKLGLYNRLYYLATPPDSYLDIVRQIGMHDMAKNDGGWTRVIIEKPYGKDLESAQELEDNVHRVFKENQVYRIDHYLGKETVQNILVLRFANGIFEPLWNRHYVDHVQITVAESMGVGTRAGYYESSGVIRDVFQNHLLQLLTLTAMEAPAALKAENVRDEKVKVLRALRPLRGKDVLESTYRAQYVSGVIDGKRVQGYKDEQNVSPNSITETYMAARLFVDNWRWAGVPFYIRSGKRLPCRATEIAIHFNQVPLSLFDWKNMAGDAPNVLILNLQPDEGITLTFGAKIPGPVNEIAPARMSFSYQEEFGIPTPEAYERLLLDTMLGDATLFTRSDEALAQWEFTGNILDAWQAYPARNLPVYEAGTWGPPGADDFIGKYRRVWLNPCPNHEEA